MRGIASGKSTSTGLNYLPAAPARTGVMLLGLLLLSQVSAAGKITYTLSFEERNAHYVTVNLELDGVRYRDSLDLKMPVWAPGSYKVRDFSRHVEGVRVTSGSREIPVSKLDKNSWRVRLSGQRRINIKYKVYAFEKSVRTIKIRSIVKIQ